MIDEDLLSWVNVLHVEWHDRFILSAGSIERQELKAKVEQFMGENCQNW